MKKFHFSSFIFGILLSCVALSSMLFFLSYFKNKNDNIKFVPAPEGFAVMIFDENTNDYVESDNLPIGAYKLNSEKSYCANGGTIESYDDKNGKVNYSVDGTDECVIYLDIVEFDFYKESNGYTFAWTENSAAESYNIYLDDTLLLNTTNTSADLYKYINDPGTYNVKASYVKSDGTEKFSDKEISYTIEKLSPNNNSKYLYKIYLSGYAVDTYIDDLIVPSDFDYINFMDITTYKIVYNYITKENILQYINNPNYCNLLGSTCVKKQNSGSNILFTFFGVRINSFYSDVNHTDIQNNYIFDATTTQEDDSNLYYDASAKKIKLNAQGTLKKNFIFQFEKKGYISSDWQVFDFYLYCVEENTYVYVYDEKRKRFRKKKIKYIKPKDKLLVWDFDNGCFTMAQPLWIQEKKIANEYNELVFSDGSKLKTINQHRILNIESGKFTYPMTDDTPLGTTTFNAKGEKVTLISKRVVRKKVKYCNIITKYHMNLFTGEILTSCRFNNLYPIKDMKFVKDDRKSKTMKDYPGVDQKYFNGLRLSEQNESVHNGSAIEAKNTLDYVNNLKKNEKKNM